MNDFMISILSTLKPITLYKLNLFHFIKSGGVAQMGNKAPFSVEIRNRFPLYDEA